MSNAPCEHAVTVGKPLNNFRYSVIYATQTIFHEGLSRVFMENVPQEDQAIVYSQILEAYKSLAANHQRLNDSFGRIAEFPQVTLLAVANVSVLEIGKIIDVTMCVGYRVYRYRPIESDDGLNITIDLTATIMAGLPSEMKTFIPLMPLTEALASGSHIVNLN